jgi:hypothetical protein
MNTASFADQAHMGLNNGHRVTSAEVVRFEEWLASIGHRHNTTKTDHKGAWSYRHMPTQYAFTGWIASHNFPRVRPC